MALFTAPTNDSRARALVQCDLFVIAENPGANNSTVRLIGRVSDNNPSFGGNSTASTWRASINGVQQATGSIAYDFTGNSGRTYQFYIGDFIIGHAANGSGSVSATTFWQGNDGLTGSATAGGTITLTDYNRSPVYSDNTVANATLNVAYSNGVAASNTASYSLSGGALPTGLSLNTSTGAITGTPTAQGTFNFIIRANGSFEGSTDTPVLTIVVNPPIPVFTDSSVASVASLYTPYSDQVTASNATSYSVFSGALPTGLSLNTSTGAITGTPNVAGSFTFVIRATNAGGSVNTGSLTIKARAGLSIWNGAKFVFSSPKIWNGTSFISMNSNVWTGSSWLTPEPDFTIQYLVVAGGGGGGNRHGGGGGAGGLLANTMNIEANTSYAVTVGGGGAGGDYNLVIGSPQGSGSRGSNSAFHTVTSQGGGGGGTYDGNPTGTFGSGGGGGGQSRPGIAGTSGQGSSGGSGANPGAGGGGGAGGVGGNANNGSGGAGLSSSITGTSTFYAGGGGGAWSTASGPATPGGSSIGGSGAWNTTTITAGTINTGSGGGGSRSEITSSAGASGGSGVVILRYPQNRTITLTGLTGTTGTVTGSTDKFTRITSGTGTVRFT
jgi:hypothetical protein